MKIAVIGAGISGLTTASLLQAKGVKITVYEHGSRAGGAIQSTRDNGWLVEHGPNSLLETSKNITNLITNLGLDHQKVYADEKAKNRFIVKNNRPVTLPTSLKSFLTTNLFPLSAKLRLLKEPFISAGTDEQETLASFVERRLGKAFLDYAINPFVSGIYAGNPRKLSVKHAFGKLYDLEQQYGSLIKGQIKGARERRKRGTVAKNKAKMFNFKDGLEILPETMARQIGDNLKLNHSVTGLTKENNGRYRIAVNNRNNQTASEELYDRVVLTIPAHGYPRISSNLFSDRLLNALSCTPYPKVSVLSLGFKASDVEHALDGFGMLVPEVEQKNILGSLFNSSIFPDRAPDDHVLITTFIGGARQSEYAAKPTSTLISDTLHDLQELIGVNGDPVFDHHTFWPKAIPQYNVGHGKILQEIEAFEAEHPGIHIHGNFRGGISLSDCIDNSYALADELVNS